jgi:DNA (cytosine-5)-methyltransferase 1
MPGDHSAMAHDPSLMRIGSLCTGYGGLDLAVMDVLGGQVAWCADDDRHVRAILAARFSGAPNLGDITGIDFSQAPPVDVLTAGFPCQDISCAGRRAGIQKGTRSGLWFHVAQAVRLLRPGLVFVENVAALRRRALDLVLGELAQAGYDAEWTSLRASDIGAAHRRERVFVLAWPADPAGTRRERSLPSHKRSDRSSHRGQTGDQCAPNGADVRDPAGIGSGFTRSAGWRGVRPSAVAAGVRAVPVGVGQRWDRTCLGPGRPAAESESFLNHRPAPEHEPLDWGMYGPAIRRWEHVLDRPAPSPTQPGRDGRPRLSPVFVEWLMGLPAGWVTGVEGVPRTAQLRALGNGVVPQQARHALVDLLTAADVGWHSSEQLAA